MYRSRGEAASSLWNAETGRPIFHATMSLEPYRRCSDLTTVRQDLRGVSLTNWQHSGMSGTSGWKGCLSCTTLVLRSQWMKDWFHSEVINACCSFVRLGNRCFSIHMLLVVISNDFSSFLCFCRSLSFPPVHAKQARKIWNKVMGSL